jgi:hypothetical protein
MSLKSFLMGSQRSKSRCDPIKIYIFWQGAVETPASIIAHIFASSLGFFGLLGMTGLYARQVEKAGWLGLAGFLLFSGWMALVGAFSFIEVAILPPPFVTGFLGMIFRRS